MEIYGPVFPFRPGIQVCHFLIVASRTSLPTAALSFSPLRMYRSCLSDANRCAGMMLAMTIAAAVETVLYDIAARSARTLWGLRIISTFLRCLRALTYIGDPYRSLLSTTVASNLHFFGPAPLRLGINLDNARAVVCAFLAAASKCALNHLPPFCGVKCIRHVQSHDHAELSFAQWPRSGCFDHTHNLSEASSMDRPFLKPNCRSFRSSFPSRCFSIRLFMSLSIIFPMVLSRHIGL